MGERVVLSQKEVERIGVLRECLDRHITQVQAAVRLKLCYRQTKTLFKRFREYGANGIVSKRRGKPSNNRIPEAVRQQALQLIRAHYRDFGPTLACEKLTQLHRLKVSRETLRKWMVDAGLWKGKSRKTPKIFQLRTRRSQLGELVQIDGSPHAWLEERAPKCTLINFVDDATGKILYAHFVEAETTASYLEGILASLKRFGRPCCYYSDKHSIFRVNLAGKQHMPTQVRRALNTLDIELINANTPQAKGRVERSHKTLQDRLVKEMRLAGVRSLRQANAFLPGFITFYNRKFSVAPVSPQDAHRPVHHTQQELTQILSVHETRKLSKALTCQFENRLYQVRLGRPSYTLRGAAVTVCKTPQGEILLVYRGKRLPYTCWEHGEMPVPLAHDKEVNHCVDRAKQRQELRSSWRPAPNHPWKKPILPGRGQASFQPITATR